MPEDTFCCDMLNLESLLSSEQKEVRNTIAEFVNNEILPRIQKHFRDGTFPHDLISTMGTLGIFGANLKGYECAGVDNISYGLIMEELERGDSAFRSFASVQGALVMYPIYQFGSEEQKQKWLPRLARGEAIGCFGLTEAEFGSNPSGMKTKAILRGSSFEITGSKMWITNGSLADVAVIWAKVPGEKEETIRGFLVEKGMAGFSSSDIGGKLSLRASVTSALHFDKCKVPAENLLPGTKGLGSTLSCLNQARYSICWGALGAARACFKEALDYSKIRIQFDKPIGSFQLVQEKLVWMAGELAKGQLLALRLGQLKDQKKLEPVQVSLGKMNNVWIALQIARMAREILGANGICDDFTSFRHMCNLESVYTYEGTHDIHKLVIGEKLTGFPAFS